MRVQRGDLEQGYGPYPASLDMDTLRALEGQAAAYGQALTSALFADARLAAAFAAERGRAEGQGVPLRVRLLLSNGAGALGLRWELLGDPQSGIPLSLGRGVYFSRYLLPEGGASAPLPARRAALRALAAAANPSNLGSYQLERIDAAKELERAERGLSPIRVERLPSAPGDLCTLERLASRAEGADILYLACHGAYRRKVTSLFLEGEDGKVKRATGEELCLRLGQLEDPPRLVALAACESAGPGTGEALSTLGMMLVAAGIPAVVAMQGPVSAVTLDLFLPRFFKELAQDGRIDRAMAAARLVASEQPDWWAPALFMRLRSARLWEGEPPGAPLAVSTLAIPHEVPAPPPNFIGRDAELAEMEAAVEAGCRVINIHGTNGVGKTAAARELVRRLQARYPGGQAYLDLQGAGGLSAVTPAQALAYLIQKFDPTLAQLPVDEKLLRGRLQSLLCGRRALLVLDNASGLAQVEAFLPPPESCLVLVTSWERLESEDAAIFNRLLGKLSAADATRLLGLLAPRAAPRAAELAERCEYLRQALDSIARRLNKTPGLSLEDLLALLDDAGERLEITGAAAMLQVSYDMLAPARKKDWRRLAVFAADFDAAAAAWVWGRVSGDTALDKLRSKIIRARLDLEDLLGCGLVEYDAARDRYLLHRLERDFAAGLADFTAQEKQEAHLAHARYYRTVLRQANDLYLEGDQRLLDGLAAYDRETREVHAAWEWLKGTAGAETCPAEILSLVASYPAAFANLMAVRLMPEERIQWLTAGRKANQVLQDRKLEVILASSLGVAYSIMDRYDESQACQVEALQPALAQAREAGENADCAGLVRVLGNLGALFRVRRRYQRALRYLGKQLELARRYNLLREEGRALGTIGRVYLDLGDTPKAIDKYQAELAITTLTGDRRARAIALGGLADAYRVLKDFERARQCLEEDIDITREIGDRRGQAIASWMLGKVYNDMGDLAKAVEYMQALVDYEREIGHQDARWHAEKVADLQARLGGE